PTVTPGTDPSFIVDGSTEMDPPLAAATVVNLTNDGTDDWRQWGNSGFSLSGDEKSTPVPTASISSLTEITTTGQTIKQVKCCSFKSGSHFQWKAGALVSKGSTRNALAVFDTPHSSVGDGFRLSVPADNTITRTLTLYVGITQGTGLLTASLNDGIA